MAHTTRSSAGWIAGIFIGVLGWFVHKLVSLCMPAPKPETGIKAAKGAYSGVPGCAEESELAEDNISLRYELMCVKEPLKYRNHPLLQKVIADYRKLLHGEIPDPEGKHVPSECINDSSNDDYEKYFKVQQKVLGNVGWVSQELKRIGKENRALLARFNLGFMVMKYGLPVESILCVVTTRRVNTYSSEQWIGLFKAVKGYLADAKRLTVHAIVSFLYDIPEYEYASSLESLELYKTYLDNGVLRPIIAKIVRGEISDDQAQRAWEISKETGTKVDFENAITTVIQEDQLQDKVEGLRETYRAQVRKG